MAHPTNCDHQNVPHGRKKLATYLLEHLSSTHGGQGALHDPRSDHGMIAKDGHQLNTRPGTTALYMDRGRQALYRMPASQLNSTQLNSTQLGDKNLFPALVTDKQATVLYCTVPHRGWINQTCNAPRSVPHSTHVVGTVIARRRRR
jgi:hypothetical protein